ncbi:hypothetical protein DM02DRAFT_675167 [Periconia macrospinosa]|uniref:Tyrosine specific protein phosphatases domain-containing protein n=1 Tax=Periconia macrospinosa TaxID=97972 RepID=A0A2V1DFK3_9PLEO|nr:hypothetical protein DM02DRAFT_675167 [Periconia macrospinosa]
MTPSTPPLPPPLLPSTQTSPTPPPPLPSPPFHPIPNVPNFRDIGGYPIIPPPTKTTSSSSSTTSTLPLPPRPRPPLRVRKNIIYRGSDPTHITPAGEAKLRALGIVRDYDLRTTAQIKRMGGGKEMEGIERVCVPLFEDSSSSSSSSSSSCAGGGGNKQEEKEEEEKTKRRYELYADDGTEGILSAFLEILLSSRTAYRAILLPLITTPSSPIISTPSLTPLHTPNPPPHPRPSSTHAAAIFLHCTTGNNRTGVLIAVLLSLLYVPAKTIAYEYALSNLGLAATRRGNIERLLAKGAFAALGDEGMRRRKCERMLSAREESVVALLKEVEGRWEGGAEGFFRDVVGLSGDEIEGVRRALTEEGEGEKGWRVGF